MAIRGQEIAIIGSGCRLPGGAGSPSKLWELLRDPRPVTRKIPAIDGYYHENGQYHGHANVKEAYLLAEDGVHRHFDAAFFGVKPAEANVMDPQIRLLLETVYEALEAGGQTMDSLRGSNTAVYAGQMVADYELLMYRDHDNLGNYHATGTARTMLSNRLSYFFDWHGPSMTIDTACSSSLVALHHAVQQLRSGHSRVAVVAGSNLIYDVGTFIAETNLQMLSHDSRSRMWDADAKGYARGEGVAAIVLKSREAAEADGDQIECIIRETAVNQDGKTPGQTMPSASAQAQLIRDCYARAGLDLTNPADRPQYFEAHGTGTPAGDPIEAEAINSAFFPIKGVSPSPVPLFVGSIKTVVGHTEGTAGIAGILKGSLALQNKVIPPNLLFNRLNPRIEPFYGNLQIPTTLTPWPTVPNGSPRRVSVNSFGFGGTNAHAILESYTPSAQISQINQLSSPVYIPFVFSAFSENSLKSYLANFRDYLRQDTTTYHLRDIAYSIGTRRTRLAVATAIGAASAEELCGKIEAKLEASRTDTEKRVGVRVARQTTDKPRVLGVFTGQGAQWAQMGLDLVTTSPAAKRILENLESRLDRLPSTDRPRWSLVEELQKDSSSSRIMEAAFSQPLCTAIQIVQVGLLRSAGIVFTAVVGHSSGEIAATYAAGLITAEDAICIAYYRGLYSALAQGSTGQNGAMMAVGTSFEDAQNLLDFDEFKGRVCVAAVNSATSVTLSGDQDAIEKLEIIFKDEHMLARVLRVDKAYHSHHMEKCSAKYLASLKALDIQIGRGNGTTWVSSVYGTEMDSYDQLKGPYWDNNMVQPVLFMQAVSGACTSVGSFDLAIELGPHPALKGPALQTIQEKFPNTTPYTGLLQRGASATTSFAHGLGYAWTHLGEGAVNLQNYNLFVSGNANSKLVKDLPTYVWDHENEYWHESRYATAIRMRPDPVHELLGHLTPNSTDQDMRWRHILRVSEMPWLQGHRLQNITVFPAAGYIVSVLEAALMVCKDAPVTLIEILDIDIDSALVFDNEDLGIEILLSLSNISRRVGKSIEAEFKYHASSGKGTEPLKLKASGHVRIHLGESSHTALPSRPPRQANLIPVRQSKFYELTSELGYEYSGPFMALERLSRKLGATTGYISMVEPSKLLIHPAALDAAVQSAFLTYMAPEDGTRKSMHVPRRIQRLSVNPNLCARERDRQRALAFDSVQPLAFPHANMVCDIDVYPDDIDHAMLQIQNLECVPFSQPTAKDDREFFSSVVWDVLDSDVDIVTRSRSETSSQSELAALLERVAGFYLRVLDREIPSDHAARLEGPYRILFEYAPNRGPQQPSWEEDTPEVLAAACEPFLDTIDMKLLSECGNNLAAIVKGDKSIQDVANLTDWYANGLWATTFTSYLARVLKQIVHRYPHMHILETAPEIGVTTKVILDEIGSKFTSYTVTTPTPGSFDLAQELSDTHKSKLITKTLDLEKDPREQGFSESSYDVIVASIALHNAPIDQTLLNARRLLKPGGHLIVLELLPSLSPFFSIIFSASPHWQLRAEEERAFSTAVSPVKWDSLLRDAGFSGVDTSTSEESDITMPFSLFVSQAVDEKISFLRDPLSPDTSRSGLETMTRDLVIIGGNSLKTTRLVHQLSAVLKQYCNSLRVTRSLSDFASVELAPDTVILSLAELDTSVFQQVDKTKWEALKKINLHTGVTFWVTHGRLADNPYANMMLGLLRGSTRDNPTLDYFLLDFEDVHTIDHRVIIETLLRHKLGSLWQKRDNIHYSNENELVVDKAGRFLIPRLMMKQDMNERYNSNWREIRGQAQPRLNNISISMSDSGYDVELDPSSRDQGVQLRTTHSLLSPVKIAEFGCMFVALGEDSVSGDKVLALSSKNNSLVSPRKELSIAVEVSPGSEARLLWLTAHFLLASIALKGLSKDDKVLIHEPTPEFASVIAEEAASLGVEVTISTTNTNSSSNWLVIHPTASERTVTRLADGGYSVFIDMASHGDVESIGDRIAAKLPLYCRKESPKYLFGKRAWNPTASYVEEIRSRLMRALERASVAFQVSGWEQIPTAAIHSLPEIRDTLEPLTVVEWGAGSGVPVQVRPVDSLVSLSGNKTYWLVGLSGGLGLSLCEWMVQKGARHFVITSRKPNIERAWLDEMRQKGVKIKISSCDVTQKDQVVRLHTEICSSMPPIAGVAQGAMVLDDTSIQGMSLEQFSRVTKPKVEGSINLNDLFQENTLDFFVFFSSVVAVVGNHGQSNYAAANNFMAALAEQRRRRGLAASVIDIGPVIGAGYISRSGEDALMGHITMQTGGYVRTSERDFHQLFGEAILAGFPGSTGQIELVSGLGTTTGQEEHRQHQPVWLSWPRMSHFIKDSDGSEDTVTSGTGAQVPIKTQLAEARNHTQVYDIIWDAFTRKLHSLFQVEVADISKSELGAMRFDEMGADSLTAVEIRGWLVKTFEVNIPVLKILNGISVGELVSTATEIIPMGLVPNLDEYVVVEASSPVDVASSASTTPEGTFDSSQEDYSISSDTSLDHDFTTAITVPDTVILKSCPGGSV